MARYYVLIKRKTSKRWMGAIPAKQNATLRQLKSLVSSKLKKGYSGRVITSSQLSSMKPKKKMVKPKRVKRVTIKKKTVKRRSPKVMRRTKVVRRRKR